MSRSGRRVSRMDELEVELVDGDDASLQRIERALRAAGALDADERPKLFRALGLGPPRGQAAPSQCEADEAPHLDAGGAVPGDPAARPRHPAGQRPRGAAPAPRRRPPAARPPAGGEADARPRIGSRTCAESWPGPAARSARCAIWMCCWSTSTRMLSTSRSEQRHAFDTLTVAITVTARGGAQADAEDPPRAALHAPARPPRGRAGRAPPGRPSSRRWKRIAGDEFERLVREMAELGPDPADTALHEARKTAKHARYAAELAERGARAQGHAVHRRHQAAAGRARRPPGRLRSPSARSASWPRAPPPEAAFAAGMLAERQRERRRVARAAYPRAWKRYANAAGPPGRDPADPARSGREAQCLGRRRQPAAAGQQGPPAGGGAARLLAGFGIERILSSPYRRCVETVEPLAAGLASRRRAARRAGRGRRRGGRRPPAERGRPHRGRALHPRRRDRRTDRRGAQGRQGVGLGDRGRAPQPRAVPGRSVHS